MKRILRRIARLLSPVPNVVTGNRLEINERVRRIMG